MAQATPGAIPMAAAAEGGRPIQALGMIAPPAGVQRILDPMVSPVAGAIAAPQVDAAVATAGAGVSGDGAGSAPTPPEQDIDKLADKVWQVVRRKLALERERRHGLS
jgi:hypothetical protein